MPGQYNLNNALASFNVLEILRKLPVSLYRQFLGCLRENCNRSEATLFLPCTPGRPEALRKIRRKLPGKNGKSSGCAVPFDRIVARMCHGSHTGKCNITSGVRGRSSSSESRVSRWIVETGTYHENWRRLHRAGSINVTERLIKQLFGASREPARSENSSNASPGDLLASPEMNFSRRRDKTFRKSSVGYNPKSLFFDPTCINVRPRWLFERYSNFYPSVQTPTCSPLEILSEILTRLGNSPPT